MRYKLLVCALVLLIATPVLAQEFSPIVIETGKPTPSVVKSGEPFNVTYRAKFVDTVLIYEEQMKPENLALDKIEATGLKVSKERVGNDTLGFINVWDFTYTFRIIQPEKGVYKIPPFNFIWVDKRAGVTEQEAKNKEEPKEFSTEEVGISYVPSLVKPPLLDIRDEINFVSPIADGAVLRRWAYGVMGVTLLLSVAILFRFSRQSKMLKSQEVSFQEIGTETADGDGVVVLEPFLTSREARKKFLGELKTLRDETQLPIKYLEKKLHGFVRAFLLAELRGTIRASMSESEIYTKLNGLDDKQKKQIGSKYAIMAGLARRLKTYQEDIDSDKCFLNVMVEIYDLESVVTSLKLQNGFWSFLKRLVMVRH